jgi:hypothetical protein
MWCYHPDLICRFVQTHQSFNVAVSHEPLHPVFCTSILESDSTWLVAGKLGSKKRLKPDGTLRMKEIEVYFHAQLEASLS